MLAVHTSLVDPLPHQITAVYHAMLQRQPLRFLLADDPGAGKTIMEGLLIKELIARGDLGVAPGTWRDEELVQSKESHSDPNWDPEWVSCIDARRSGSAVRR